SPEDAIRPGATGRAVPGYEACILDENGREAPPGTLRRLGVRGPTGCRYLADARQTKYVQGGWNATGDSYAMDADGYFWREARSGGMMSSAGNRVAGPHVEAALRARRSVAEWGVVGAADGERGQSGMACVVPAAGAVADATLARQLQDHVKATIAPYKYPR